MCHLPHPPRWQPLSNGCMQWAGPGSVTRFELWYAGVSKAPGGTTAGAVTRRWWRGCCRFMRMTVPKGWGGAGQPCGCCNRQAGAVRRPCAAGAERQPVDGPYLLRAGRRPILGPSLGTLQAFGGRPGPAPNAAAAHGLTSQVHARVQTRKAPGTLSHRAPLQSNFHQRHAMPA